MQKLILIISLFGVLFCACSKDDIPDPYQPELLPLVQQITYSNGSGSSSVTFDTNMKVVSGSGMTVGNRDWQETFGMEYMNEQLTSAEYEYTQATRLQARAVTFTPNDRNMVAKVSDDKKSIALDYNERYQLFQITIPNDQSVNTYTITYEGSNVSEVEIHETGGGSDGYTKWVFSGYDIHYNPFRFLVNVFYTPAFASNYGVLLFQNIPLGILLSANNPQKAEVYRKYTSEYVKETEYTYDYQYDEETGFPVSISGGTLLFIEYDFGNGEN